MFRHILVPVDLSDRNERTLATALDLARSNRARVTLLHVVHRVPGLAVRDLRGLYQRLERTSRRRLQQAARRFAAAGLPVRCRVIIGEPAREIVATTTRTRVDLIVMGSHRVDPARRGRGWGTISYKVGILCQCPVMLVK